MNTLNRNFVGLCTWCTLGALAVIGVVSTATLIWVAAL